MMESERIVAAANAAVFQQADRYLSDVETTILLGAIADQTYEQIAASSNYSINYLKRDIGPKLWRLLSEALGEKISKTNFQVALSRYPVEVQTQPHPAPSAHCDWGAAPDVSFFLGRSTELDTLQQWIVGDACRLIALLGIGGIGKTSLAVKLAHQLQYEFGQIVWRSLRNAPPLETLLTELMPLLSGQTEYRPELDALLSTLRATKCLLVLDNLEAILQPESLGLFRPGYEDYGQLLQLVGDTAHTCCLVITSREKPEIIAAREGPALAVRSLVLGGLKTEAEALLSAKGLLGDSTSYQTLIEVYGGNPLALKIAATSIQDLFDSNVAIFLAQETVLFNGVRHLLDQQFDRLSDLEHILMLWLAINREWTTVESLLEDVVPPVSRYRLLEALEALCRRNLLEKKQGQYTQQPVVMEYVCDRIIEQIVQEVTTAELSLFCNYALVKTTVPEYVRDSQIRLILDPVVSEFRRAFTTPAAVEHQFLHLLETLRRNEPRVAGYGGGNLINFGHRLGVNLSGVDFSGLQIWHACLQQVPLHQTNFAQADLSKSLFKESFASVLCVAFNPDGHFLASGDTEGQLYVRQLPGGQVVQTRAAHQSWTRGITFSPDSTRLASGSHDFTVKIWDLRTGQCLHTLQHDNLTGRVAWSPDSHQLASVCFDQNLRIWDTYTGECLHVLQAHTPQVVSVSWHPDGHLVACTGGDHTVLVWDAHSGELIQTLSNGEDLVWYVAFSPDGHTLASSLQGSQVQLWDVHTWDCIQTLQGDFGVAWSLAFSPDSASIAGGCQDGRLRLWDVETGDCVRTFQRHVGLVWSVAFSPNGRVLASGSEDQTIKLWDVATGSCLQTYQGYSGAVWDVEVSLDGQQLVSGHQDGCLRIWDLETDDCLQTLQGHTGGVWATLWHPQEALLLSASYDTTLKLWSTLTGECLHTFDEHVGLVQTAAWHPNGREFASGGLDGMVKIWNSTTGQCQQTLNPTILVGAVAWHPQGQLLASSIQTGQVQLWDATSGRLIQSLQGHTDIVFSLAFSPNGQTFASGSHDNTVKLWDVETGECLQTFTEHSAWVWSVGWHPDGHRLASTSQDGTTRLWDVQTHECCLVLRGSMGPLRSLSWSPDGTRIATGSLDSTIKIWDATTGDCLKTLQAKRPYEAMNLTGTTGLTSAQKVSLTALGAITKTSVNKGGVS